MEYCESLIQKINPDLQLTEEEKEIINTFSNIDDLLATIVDAYGLKGIHTNPDIILCRTLSVFLTPKYMFGNHKADEYVIALYKDMHDALEEQKKIFVNGGTISYDTIFEIIHKMNIILFNQKLARMNNLSELFISDVDVIPDGLIDLFANDWEILDANERINAVKGKGFNLKKGVAQGMAFALGGGIGIAALTAGSYLHNKSKTKKSNQLVASLYYFVIASILTELRVKTIKEECGNVW